MLGYKVSSFFPRREILNLARRDAKFFCTRKQRIVHCGMNVFAE